MSEQEQERIEAEQKAQFKRYFESLFDVSHFLERYVNRGEEMDMLADMESLLSLRRAFTIAPEALGAAKGLLDNRLEFCAQDFETWVRACRAPIGELESDTTYQDEDEEGGEA